MKYTNEYLLKIFLVLVIGLLIIPQETFAAWWNPFTWKIFKKAPETKVEKTIVIPSTLQSPISNTDSQSSKTEDLKKSLDVPKNNPPLVNSTPKQSASSKNIDARPISSTDSNIKGKIQYIVQIICPIKGGTMSGTGIMIYGSSVTDDQVVTNKHVLNGATGPCGIYKTSDYKTSPTLYYKSGKTFILSTNYDLAVITPDVLKLTVHPDTNVIFSNSNDLLDKSIYVLGYPASAGNNITLTKGIISGTENINNITMYKTDAKIDKGNSGGAVFDESGDFIGVPTLASQGSFSSYGYIIPASIVKNFLNIVEQEGYGKQNWQNPALSLYSVNPSNAVPEPPSSVTQNPAPNNPAPQQQEDSNLKIARCKAEAQTMKDTVYNGPWISAIKTKAENEIAILRNNLSSADPLNDDEKKYWAETPSYATDSGYIFRIQLRAAEIRDWQQLEQQQIDAGIQMLTKQINSDYQKCLNQ